MTTREKEKQLQDQVQQPQSSAQNPALPALPSADAKPAPQTAGQSIVDFAIFKGVGLFVNEALSLGLAVEARMSKHFGKVADTWANFRKITPKVDQLSGHTVSARAQASNSLVTLLLLTGGTLLIWPMKKLDEARPYLVKKANHVIDYFRGNHDEAAIAKRDADVDAALACEPKQSWTSFLVGRTVAVAGTMAFGNYIMGKKRNDYVEKFSEEKLITPAANAVNHMIGGDGNSRLGKAIKGERFKSYAGLAGVETIYCVMSSAILEFTSKLFAKTMAKKSPSPDCPPEELAAPTAAHTDSSAPHDEPAVKHEDKPTPAKRIISNKSHDEDFAKTVRSERAAGATYAMAP